MVVEAAERAGDVGALLFLDFEHQFPDIGRNRVHSEGVEASFKHMRLDAGLVERGGPAADGHVRVFAEKEVHLLERAAVGLDAVEAAHINDGRCHLDKLVHAGNVLA